MPLPDHPAWQAKLLTDVLCLCIHNGRAAGQLPEPRRRALLEPLVGQHLRGSGPLDLNAIWLALLHEPGVTERALASAFAAMEDLEVLLGINMVHVERLKKLTPAQRKALLGECPVGRVEVERMLRNARIEAQLSTVRRSSSIPPVKAPEVPGPPAAAAVASVAPPLPPAVPAAVQTSPVPKLPALPNLGAPPPPPAAATPTPAPAPAPMGSGGSVLRPAELLAAAAARASTGESSVKTGVPAALRATTVNTAMAPRRSTGPSLGTPATSSPSGPRTTGSTAVLPLGSAVDSSSAGSDPEAQARVLAARSLLQQAHAEMLAEAVRSRPNPTVAAGQAQRSRRSPERTARRKSLVRVSVIGGFVLCIGLAAIGIFSFASAPRAIDTHLITALQLSEAQQQEDNIKGKISDPRWKDMSEDVKRSVVNEIFEQLRHRKIRSLTLVDPEGRQQAQAVDDSVKGQQKPLLILLPNTKRPTPPPPPAPLLAPGAVPAQPTLPAPPPPIAPAPRPAAPGSPAAAPAAPAPGSPAAAPGTPAEGAAPPKP